MLLDGKGLKLTAFDPVLGAVLGNSKGEEGCKVLKETDLHKRAQVQLRDWLYCLAKAPGTWVRKRLIEAPGQTPERFVAGIEGGIDDENEPKGITPDELNSKTVAPAVLTFLETAEGIAQENASRNINDAALTLALLRTLDGELREMLVKWVTPEGYKRFVAQLEDEVAPRKEIEIFHTRFQSSDIKDISGLVARIRSNDDAISRYLGSNLSSKLLEEPGNSTSALQQVTDLADAMNQLLNNKGLLEAAIRAAGSIGESARASLAKQPEGESLAASNRLLLDLVYKDLLGPGKINEAIFDVNGRKLCSRLREDAASLGARKITTRHLLYTLLGNESGLLPVSLAIRGVDVKKEPHAALSRELARPGQKRNDAFELTRDTVFPSVEQLFKDSLKLARERGAKAISEFDVGRAFVLKQSPELARLFAANKPLDLAGLRAYVESAEPDAEEELKPVQRLSIKEIDDKIKARVLGQEAAVNRVIPWIKRLRFGLPRDGRPAGVFLFLGPTGTGKTQLAKELARHVFGDEDMMLFMEMGQFKSEESMSIFVGAPPGYKGYGDGQLTNGLRAKPECVVLFDEIEKANVTVFDTLLRFADEGVISDPAGPVRDGRKCIIVMTTNAGQDWLIEHLKTNPGARDDPLTLSKQLFEEAKKEMKTKGFRPEFLGRVDERISFLPFTSETCRKIVDSVLERELDKFKKRDIIIEVPDGVRAVLATKAYERSTEEGARGAPRAVNEWIVTPAIDKLSENETEDETGEPKHLIASTVGLDKIKLDYRSEARIDNAKLDITPTFGLDRIKLT